MKPTTEHLNQTLKEAHKLASRNFFISKHKETDIFNKINLFSEIQETLPFLPLVFNKNKKLARIIAEKIHELLAGLSIKELEKLDEKMRKTTYTKNFFSQTIFNFFNKKMVSQDISNSILILLCMHPSGYIRKLALELLSGDYPELNIPILIIRANDWVPEIRDTAILILKTFFNKDNLHFFCISLNLIGKLYNKERNDQSIIINEMENYLIKKGYQELLSTILTSSTPTNRIALNIASKNIAQITELIEVATKSDDIKIKLESLRLAKEYMFGSALWNTLNNLLSDKSVIVRRKCIYILMEKFSTNINETLIELLFDKFYSIRELARFYLKHMGIDKIKNLYSEALTSGKRPIHICIMGIAEIGTQADFKFVENYSANPCLKIKMAYLYSVFKLKPDNKQALLLEQLPSTKKNILKLIYDQLTDDSSEFNLAEIENKFCHSDDVYCKFLLIKIKIASENDRWKQIKYIIETLLNNHNEKITTFLKQKVSHWIRQNCPNKVFIKIKKETIHSLIIKIDKLMQKQNDVLYKDLKNTINYFI